MEKLNISEADIYYLDYNPNGKPVVLLLHGLGVDGGSWGYQIPALCEAGYRPIAPDIPGFGKSKYHGRNWTIQNVTKMIAMFTDHLSIENVVVVGISMGGAIALEFALDFKARTERLILINTFASLRPRKINEMIYLGSRFAVANLRGKDYQSRMVAQRLFPKPEQERLRAEIAIRIKQSDARVYRSAMWSLGLFNARNRLGDVKTPTLVITGAQDSTVGMDNQMELVRGISGTQHVIIQNAGHAVIADQPELVNHHIIRFIGESL